MPVGNNQIIYKMLMTAENRTLGTLTPSNCNVLRWLHRNSFKECNTRGNESVAYITVTNCFVYSREERKGHSYLCKNLQKEIQNSYKINISWIICDPK